MKGYIKELAYRRILKANQLSKGKSVRTFLPPLIYFEASDYIELIDWAKCKLSSPPVMESVPTESILLFLERKDLPELEFLKFPCHTHGVETCVKLVTEFAEKHVDKIAEMGI